MRELAHVDLYVLPEHSSRVTLCRDEWGVEPSKHI